MPNHNPWSSSSRAIRYTCVGCSTEDVIVDRDSPDYRRDLTKCGCGKGRRKTLGYFYVCTPHARQYTMSAIRNEPGRVHSRHSLHKKAQQACDKANREIGRGVRYIVAFQEA